MRNTVTLWAYSEDDLQTLSGALQHEFGNKMHVTQEATPMVWRKVGEDHETQIGYTARVLPSDQDNPTMRFISKVDLDTDEAKYELTARMRQAVEGIAEGRKNTLVNGHSVSLGRQIVQLVETDQSDKGASGPADPVSALA
jgi:hypothetical protein